MGLDSIELVVNFEDFFKIQIPDKEAAKMATIQMATDYISSQTNYSNRGIDIKQLVAEQLNAVFKTIGIDDAFEDRNKNISELIQFNDKELIKKLSIACNLELPDPVHSIGKLLKYINILFPSTDKVDDATLDRYLDLICIVNYRQLIEKDKIQNKYEVLIMVMAITMDKTGCEAFEIFPESRFVDDLGIN